MSMLHIEEVGAKNFDDALKLLIRSCRPGVGRELGNERLISNKDWFD